MSIVYKWCNEYSKCFSKKSKSILMYGKTGLGKTHYSLAIAKAVLEQGYSTIYYSALNLFFTLEKEQFHNKAFDEPSINDILESIDLLIIDDLGVEYDNKFYKSCLHKIIESRLNSQLPTIINTNFDFNDIEHKYGQRICSRLIGEYVPIQFLGKDIRQLKKQSI